MAATTSKTGTYKASTSTKATPGTSSTANSSLQSSLNAKGANIKVDGKYGPETAAAVAKYGGSSSPITSTDAAKTSTAYRSDIKNIDRDITGLKNAYAVDDANLRAYQDTLAKRRVDEIAGIKSEFDIAKTAQEIGQGKDYESRATSLITSGGGFLGATQSQQGVLQNLKGTFEAERTALMSKREAAILAAQNAYDEKDFAAARELSKNARELQKEIYSRQKDYADQSLAIARENRAQTEFDMGITDKKIKAYASMSDEQFKNVDTTETDANFYPGYTQDSRNALKSENALKKYESIIDMRAKTPAGQKFEFDGVTYTGLKESSSSGVNEKPLSALDIKRYNELYNVNLPAGVTNSQAIKLINDKQTGTNVGTGTQPLTTEEKVTIDSMSEFDVIETYGTNYKSKEELIAKIAKDANLPVSVRGKAIELVKSPALFIGQKGLSYNELYRAPDEKIPTGQSISMPKKEYLSESVYNSLFGN